MMHKQRLVVIGNGMAGARLVEEVLTCGGQDRFEIVVFGDEPYGNYNRILLSSVLAGLHDPKDIFINPFPWYKEHGIKLYAGNRVHMIDHTAKMVYASDDVAIPYDKLVIATGSSPFIPALDNLAGDESKLKTGVFVFRTMDDCEADDQIRHECPQSRRDRRRRTWFRSSTRTTSTWTRSARCTCSTTLDERTT